MSKKVLVTGAGGYIGRHVVSSLLDYGTAVVACDVHLDGIDPRAQVIATDIFSGNKDIFKQLGSPDVCIHMAWRDGFVHNSEAHMEDLSKHYMFIRDMVMGGLGQVAIMGTMHEVGYWEGAIDEDTPCNPVSMYGIAKDALRRSVFEMARSKGFVWQWLRAYYIYGDDKNNRSIFAKILQAAEEGVQMFPFTSGKNLYDFIHVSELARQIAAASLQNEVVGIINCCTGKPTSLAEKVEGFIQDHGLAVKLEYNAFPDRLYDSPGVWGDSVKIEKIIKKYG